MAANENKPATVTTNAVKKEDVKKLSFGKRVGKWWREMKSELKKVIWPSRNQIVNNTVVALVVMVASAIVIWGFDEIAQLIVQAVITLAGKG
ncbi:MAG: preprotein translocase subunit SecE [Oscillospiraceae bacterium]|nr:preprotein translocase subunit SecE [Oscillospiraceae bacterium]